MEHRGESEEKWKIFDRWEIPLPASERGFVNEFNTDSARVKSWRRADGQSLDCSPWTWCWHTQVSPWCPRVLEGGRRCLSMGAGCQHLSWCSPSSAPAPPCSPEAFPWALVPSSGSWLQGEQHSEDLGSWEVCNRSKKVKFRFSPKLVWGNVSAGAKEMNKNPQHFYWCLNRVEKSSFLWKGGSFGKWLIQLAPSVVENRVNNLWTFKCAGTWAK